MFIILIMMIAYTYSKTSNCVFLILVLYYTLYLNKVIKSNIESKEDDSFQPEIVTQKYSIAFQKSAEFRVA